MFVEDAVKNQMISGVPVCTFYGRVDSSLLVSAICASGVEKKRKETAHVFV